VAAVPLLPGRRWGRALLAVALIAVTLPSAVNAIPVVHRLRSYEKRYTLTDIRGDSIWIHRQHAILLERVRFLVNQWVKDDQTMFIAPHDTMLYTALGLKAPIWDCYILWPHSEKKQMEMIRQLDESNAQWALLSFFAVDNRDDLTFRKSQPLLWRHVTRNFARMEGTGLPPDRVFLRRKARLGPNRAPENPQ
jgi:hypothetical protein